MCSLLPEDLQSELILLIPQTLLMLAQEIVTETVYFSIGFSEQDELRTYVMLAVTVHPGPAVIKLFSCSTQMSMKFSPLIYVKMPTIGGILTCMSGKNSILGLSEPKKC